MGFVHRRTGEVLVFGELPPTPKCTSRPDCPCDFCVRVRVEITEGRSEKDEQKTIAEDFLRSYSQTKLARGKPRQDDQRHFIPVSAPRRGNDLPSLQSCGGAL